MVEQKNTVESAVKNIHRKTKKQYTVVEKIRLIVEGMRGEEYKAELCHREDL